MESGAAWPAQPSSGGETVRGAGGQSWAAAAAISDPGTAVTTSLRAGPAAGPGLTQPLAFNHHHHVTKLDFHCYRLRIPHNPLFTRSLALDMSLVITECAVIPVFSPPCPLVTVPRITGHCGLYSVTGAGSRSWSQPCRADPARAP